MIRARAIGVEPPLSRSFSAAEANETSNEGLTQQQQPSAGNKRDRETERQRETERDRERRGLLLRRYLLFVVKRTALYPQTAIPTKKLRERERGERERCEVL